MDHYTSQIAESENINITCHDAISYQKARFDKDKFITRQNLYSKSYRIDSPKMNDTFIETINSNFQEDHLWFDSASEDYYLCITCAQYRIEFEKRYPMSSGCDLIVQATSMEVLNELMVKLKSLFPEKGKSEVKINWFYMNSRNELSSVEISLDETHVPMQEMYPFLDCPLNEYYQKFIDSKSNVLLLIGPPGTGKTTFIRGLLSQARKKVMTSSDASTLVSDNIFIEFISGQYEYLVVEDADEFLLSRDNERNCIMNKLLNTSDGIISVPKSKKMIFSTNIKDVNSIDEALIRPGRCFDVLTFDTLKEDQARILFEKLNLKDVEIKKEMTIAEIMTQKNNILSEKTKKPKIGFNV